MWPLTQVINQNQINFDNIYFCEGISYVLDSCINKSRVTQFKFRPLVGQSISAQLQVSSKKLILRNIFISGKRPNIFCSSYSQISLL